MSEHDRGQLDTSGAETYESLFVPSLFGRFADSVADLTDLSSHESVLDVACGTGALTRAVRARTAARVVGVDINPAMISVALRRGGEIAYVLGDAANLDFDDKEFDVAVSQFGLMFLENPSRAVDEMVRVSDRGVVAVWGPIDTSDGYMSMQELFRSELGDAAAASLDAPFAMGRDGVLDAVLDASEAENVEFTSIEGTGRFDSIEQWVTTEVRGWTLGDSVSDDQLTDLLTKARDHLDRFASDDGVVFQMTAKVAAWRA